MGLIYSSVVKKHLFAVCLAVAWISAFRLLDYGSHTANYFHKAKGINFKMAFKARISLLDGS
jgi:hypothetical protein